MNKMMAALVLSLFTATSSAAAPTPSMEEMWGIIQQQQTEIAALKQQLMSADAEIKETNVKVEATASRVEDGIAAGGSSIASSWAERTSFGGYAEMHYNNLEDKNDTGKDKDEIDFHRFVLYFAHEFSERTRMYSELELEHSFVESDDSNDGELELEQAYIEHDLTASTHLKAGLFLIPVGILNQTHEPGTFYGVERNKVEKNIIPTTWWAGGLGLNGEIAPGWSYDTAFTSGLKLDAQDGQFKIRDGRQKVSKADASDPAYTANLKYTGIAGLELGATIQYQQDLYQGKYRDDVDAVLYSAHVAYRNGPFGLRALAATWDINNAINDIKLGADEQEGWYVEPSWRFMRDLGVFARYSEWDNQAGGGGDTEFSEWDVGLNYWLDDNVVFKLDYQFQDAPANEKELEGLNLGVGWSY
ncbi:MAG: porin [Halioglobus sp.]|nr:porin [Halioglobus sp.]